MLYLYLPSPGTSSASNDPSGVGPSSQRGQLRKKECKNPPQGSGWLQLRCLSRGREQDPVTGKYQVDGEDMVVAFLVVPAMDLPPQRWATPEDPRAPPGMLILTHIHPLSPMSPARATDSFLPPWKSCSLELGREPGPAWPEDAAQPGEEALASSPLPRALQ